MTLQWDDEHELGGSAEFSLRGKGDKFRDVALNADQADIHDRWWRFCGEPENGYIIRSVSKAGTVGDGESPITGRALEALIKRRQDRADADQTGLHAFRRQRATDELKQNAPITHVARRLCHSNVATTQQYDVADAELDAATGRALTGDTFRR